MNDIAKMRAEFEEKIRLAKLENMYNEPLEEHGLSLSIFTKDKSGRLLASVRVDRSYDKPFNEHDAQLILSLYPMTEKKRVYVGGGKYDELSYEMGTERCPSKSQTILKIRYIHNELEIWMELPINERNPELMQYFMKTQRELDNREIGLYYGAVSPRAKSNVRMLPFLTFNSGRVVRFQGGYHMQASEGHVCCIASSIEFDTFSWENQE